MLARHPFGFSIYVIVFFYQFPSIPLFSGTFSTLLHHIYLPPVLSLPSCVDTDEEFMVGCVNPSSPPPPVVSEQISLACVCLSEVFPINPPPHLRYCSMRHAPHAACSARDIMGDP